MRGIDLGGWSVRGLGEATGDTGWKWCNRIGDSGTAGLKGTESWGQAAKWDRLTWGLFRMEIKGTGPGVEREVGVGGTE